jgi:hypothetical protein
MEENSVTKRAFLIIILCLLTAMPLMADPYHGGGYSGGSANYTRLDGYYYRDGGEFTLYGQGLTLSNSEYSSSTSGLGGYSESFQTFCMERDEYAGSANIWVSTEYVDGTPGSHAYQGGINTNSGDNLDSRTAYLYYQFAKGTLSNYDYSSGSGRSYSAGQLQKAIWYIENELRDLRPRNTQAWAWINEAQAQIDSKAWIGIGNVRVLQMYTCDEHKQDFLYVEPVPVPGAVLLGILGMGVAGIKLRKYA